MSDFTQTAGDIDDLPPAEKPPPGGHREALEAVLRSGAGRITDAEAALVRLARTLADQCDRAGEKGPGTRLVQSYLTTLRTLAPVLGRAPGRPQATALSTLRARHARGEGGAA